MKTPIKDNLNKEVITYLKKYFDVEIYGVNDENRLHCLTGPAIEYKFKNNPSRIEWWIDGVQFKTFEQFIDAAKDSNLLNAAEIFNLCLKYKK